LDVVLAIELGSMPVGDLVQMLVVLDKHLDSKNGKKWKNE